MGYSAEMVGVGVILGFASGLFGVGGSSIATPLLRLFDVPRLIALGTPLPVTVTTALAGGYAYWRRGLVNTRVALWTAAGGVPAITAGSYLTLYVPGRLLMILTGAFVVVVGIRLLIPDSAAPESAERRKIAPLALVAVGVGIGFLSGLLANGGGFLFVPAYVLLFSMDTQEAAATSLVAVALLAVPGTWVHWRLGHVDATLALLLSLGVIPSSYVGARVGLALDKRMSRLAFGWFMLIFGLLFTGRTIYRAKVFGWFS